MKDVARMLSREVTRVFSRVVTGVLLEFQKGSEPRFLGIFYGQNRRLASHGGQPTPKTTPDDALGLIDCSLAVAV